MSSQNQSQHQFVDVASDGNCFYTCLLEATFTRNMSLPFILSDNDTDDEEDDDEAELSNKNVEESSTSLHSDIMWLRKFTADALKAEPETLTNLYQLIKVAPQVAHNFPLAENFHMGTEREFIQHCLNNITTNQTWASEIENRVFQNELRQRDVDLLTVSVSHIEELDLYYDVEQDIYNFTMHSTCCHCIILININGYHYQYLTLKDKGIINVKKLKNYMKQYIDFCKE